VTAPTRWSDDIALRDLLSEFALMIAHDVRCNADFEEFIARQYSTEVNIQSLTLSLRLNQERTERLALLFHIMRTLGDDEDALRALYRRALGSQRGQAAA